MNSKTIKHSTLVAALFLVSNVSWAKVPQWSSVALLEGAAAVCTDLPGDLAAAAQDAGIPIHVEQIATTTAEAFVFTAAPVVDLAYVPPAAFAHGVDAAFMYLNAPATNIPTGYYRVTVTAKASDIRVGTYGGSVGLFALNGNEVARASATFETSSLTVPESLPFRPALVTVRGSPHHIQGGVLLNPTTLTVWTPTGLIFIHDFFPA
ncbi:hypothetical protein [Myxococcus qinghaiensis]|uniref:hypothetical protein n=1 Tax=Myxococcus qinghaiensis TaxID=2906758 RepID=UPI0020A7AA2C|nr:hypothetical protein [Myxococcus qinghaiensis]MCP3164379.1 hypothetical protein [Myxococcus qinghaiensis]